MSRYGPARRPLEDRFWEKVVRKGDSECWGWRGANVQGYGVVGSGGRESKSLRANRVSWELHFGAIPDGLNVCHRCDNPPCTNPHHLYLATQRGNLLDMQVKGRAATSRETRHLGEENGRAKLTEDQVTEARTRYAAGGVSYRSLGEEFGVSATAMRFAVLGLRWSHVPMEVTR